MDTRDELDGMKLKLEKIGEAYQDLGRRLDALEARQTEKKAVPEPKAEDVEEEEWVKDMLALGGQADGDPDEARKEVWTKHQEKDLSAEETKKKFQQDRQDEKWAKDMLKLGGQEG